MKIAIYSRVLKTKDLSFIQYLLAYLSAYNTEIYLYQNYYEQLKQHIQLSNSIHIFHNHEDLPADADCLFSLGGDGTLLDTVNLIRNSQIPILGINIGRLGFLANAGKNDLAAAIKALKTKNYTLDQRTLLHLDSKPALFQDFNYALNEFTIHKQDSSSMIIIHAYVDGIFLNSYWADGIIVATPTGSTAYSLSCGGPIVAPNAAVFIITPVAAHNLNVRPIVIPDNQVITFEVEGRHDQFVCTLDSRFELINRSYHLSLKKENFTINLLRLSNNNFFTTIKDKLMWGADIRN